MISSLAVVTKLPNERIGNPSHLNLWSLNYFSNIVQIMLSVAEFRGFLIWLTVPNGMERTEIMIMPDGNHWTAVIEGHPRKQFATRAAVWSFVLGIVSKELITVKVMSPSGGIAAEVTLNASLQ